jgi:excisionase family DNA binding protein
MRSTLEGVAVVMGHLLLLRLAAEYLEVSVPTLRRYVQSGKLVPSHEVGRNQMFSASTLRAFKRSRGSRGLFQPSVNNTVRRS